MLMVTLVFENLSITMNNQVGVLFGVTVPQKNGKDANYRQLSPCQGAVMRCTFGEDVRGVLPDLNGNFDFIEKATVRNTLFTAFGDTAGTDGDPNKPAHCLWISTNGNTAGALTNDKQIEGQVIMHGSGTLSLKWVDFGSNSAKAFEKASKAQWVRLHYHLLCQNHKGRQHQVLLSELQVYWIIWSNKWLRIKFCILSIWWKMKENVHWIMHKTSRICCDNVRQTHLRYDRWESKI